MTSTLTRRVLLMLAVALLAGCAASERMRKEGLELVEQGRVEEGLSKLEEATREDPKDVKARTSLTFTRERVVARMLETADRALATNNLAEAETLYRRVQSIEPRNERALAGLRSIERRGTVDDLVKQGQAALKKGEVDAAALAQESAAMISPRHTGVAKLKAEIDEAKLRENISYPSLKSKLSKPVTLEFRDANLKMVFDVLARTSGINFVFDKDVRSDLKATIFVKKIAVEDAIDLLLLQSGLEKRVINENTLMIYPNTPQKLKEFQDLVIKTFYITNADVKQTLNMLKTILKTKDIYVDEKLNMLIMRDTPDAIRIAEKLIASQDIADPEVMLEIEVLEINRNKLLDLGMQWPSTLSAANTQQRPGTGDAPDNPPIFDPVTQTLKAVSNSFPLSGWTVDRSLVLKLISTDTDSRQLASPRIRVRNKEKAKIHVGDRVPVVTAVISGGNTGNTNSIVTDQIQYLDTGIKLDVEPVVQNDEVAIKVSLDVSAATPLQATRNGSIPVQVSTRSATTILRIKDGETNALAGLIQNTATLGRDSLPFLGEIPILGRIFGTNRDNKTETELVLLITPRILRPLQRPDSGITESFTGTETTLKARMPGQRPVAETESVQLRGTAPAPRPAATPARPAAAPGAAPAAAPASIPAPISPEAPQEPAAGASGQPLALTLQGSPDVKLGQEFTVVLMAQAQPDHAMLSSAIQVTYDTQALRVVEVSEGELMKQDGLQTNFSHKVDPATGKIFVGLSRAGSTGVSGQGSLVTVKFVAQAEKPAAPVAVSVFSGVGTGNRLLPSNLPAPISIKVSP